jgi:hypothetical protein
MAAKVQSSETLSGTCGVGLFYEFYDNSYRGRYEHSRPYGGCGWNIAGFVNDTDSKEVYEDLKTKYKIVTQSPVRRNSNSGNNFFYVMYDCKKPRKSKKNPEANYDLSGNAKLKWPWKTT